jgi:hypothetical protein
VYQAANSDYSIHQDLHVARYRHVLELGVFGPEETLEITIATQCDIERFKSDLPELASVWEGPMVVVVYVPTHAALAVSQIRQLLQQPESASLARCVRALLPSLPCPSCTELCQKRRIPCVVPQTGSDDTLCGPQRRLHVLHVCTGVRRRWRVSARCTDGGAGCSLAVHACELR